LLVDARKGVIEQTRRHAYIVALLGVSHVVVCINKMDLVSYSEEEFRKVQSQCEDLASTLSLKSLSCIPVSGLQGDNVVDRSTVMSWYDGPALLEHLETVEVKTERNLEQPRMFVQWVIRVDNDEHRDFRGYAGEITSGVFVPGDAVTVLPSGVNTHIKDILRDGAAQEQAFSPMSVIVRLADEVDVSRGDLIVSSSRIPYVTRTPAAKLCWMSQQPLVPGKRLLLKIGSRTLKAAVQQISAAVDIHTYDEIADPGTLTLNDIGTVSFKLAEQLAYDAYNVNRYTGGVILIDEGSHETVAAGMLLPQNYPAQNLEYSDYVI
jgi:sulfate adenylyltransferase large subunit